MPHTTARIANATHPIKRVAMDAKPRTAPWARHVINYYYSVPLRKIRVIIVHKLYITEDPTFWTLRLKCPEKRCHDWTKTRRYQQRFTSWLYHYRTNFHIPARKVFISCKGCGHIFCWTGKSILYYPVTSENFLRCALGVRWWRLLLAGRQVTVYCYSGVCIRVGWVKSQAVCAGVEIPQRCVLSPIFFIVNIYMNLTSSLGRVDQGFTLGFSRLNRHLIGFLFCATMPEWKTVVQIQCAMSLQKPMAIYVAG